MDKLTEMKNKLENLKNEAQVLLDNNKIEDAKAKIEEVKAQKEAIKIQEVLDKEEKEILKAEANTKNEKVTEEEKTSANAIRAMIKKTQKKPLTEAENSLLLPLRSNGEGANGEQYILPEDVKTIINKKVREYKSLRDVLGYMPTNALTGSFPVENFETVSGLVDFTDGEDGEDNKEIKFKNIKFSLVEKAAFIKLSNTLLNLTDNALIQYVADVFARKAVVTENMMGVATLKSNKVVKALADWKALKSSINKDLDPASLFATTIVTNQDGFDILDSAEDKNGRPILQPNPTDPTKKMFNGYNIEVFSNAMIPSTETEAPIFYGDLKDGAKYVDLNGQVAFATSTEAGFYSNTTVARLIEFIDCVQCDSSDKCYIYGTLPIPKVGK